MWNELSQPWQAAFEQAWEAYRGGSIPIGAALADEHGAVISVGRSMQYEHTAPEGHICWSKLSHAELNALLQVSGHDHPNIRGCALYTTVEPCPLCFGAMVMSHVRTLYYAARDGWAGSANLAQGNSYIASKLLKIHGPVETLEAVSAMLHTDHVLRLLYSQESAIIKAWEKDCPQGVELGKKWHAEGKLQRALQEGRSIGWVFNEAIRELSAL